jgi:hypothetical protein
MNALTNVLNKAGEAVANIIPGNKKNNVVVVAEEGKNGNVSVLATNAVSPAVGGRRRRGGKSRRAAGKRKATRKGRKASRKARKETRKSRKNRRNSRKH